MRIFPAPTPESPPMFKSDFVDHFSRTHWATVPLLFVPAELVMLWLGMVKHGVGVATTAGIAVLGFLTWTLTEYWLHRTVFHWQPPGAFGERLHFVLHGVHHKWPRDRFRLVMPVAVSISLFWIFLSLFLWLIGSHAYGFHVGFVAGYLFYDLSHYYMHHGHPTSDWMKKLRKHHMVHHSPNYADEKKFGVSTTLWDHVFGTYGEQL